MKLFPEGTVSLTSSSSYENDPEIHISFQELVQMNRLKEAFLTSMCIDFEWLHSQLPLNIPIKFYSDYDKKNPQRKAQKINLNWSLAFPAFQPYLSFGTMHAKLMVLLFEKHARIVISSGNLMPFDYDEVENILFIQDFQLLDPNSSGNPAGKTNDFVRCLIRSTRFYLIFPFAGVNTIGPKPMSFQSFLFLVLFPWKHQLFPQAICNLKNALQNFIPKLPP